MRTTTRRRSLTRTRRWSTSRAEACLPGHLRTQPLPHWDQAWWPSPARRKVASPHPVQVCPLPRSRGHGWRMALARHTCHICSCLMSLGPSLRVAPGLSAAGPSVGSSLTLDVDQLVPAATVLGSSHRTTATGQPVELPMGLEKHFGTVLPPDLCKREVTFRVPISSSTRGAGRLPCAHWWGRAHLKQMVPSINPWDK